MSQKEFQRVKVTENAAFERASGAAAETRLSARFLELGAAWQSRTLHALGSPRKQLILTLARGNYQGFNDSHLTEKLHGEENLALSRETVRCILRAAKLSAPQKRRLRKYRSPSPAPTAFRHDGAHRCQLP
jgi:hypothetical protein